VQFSAQELKNEISWEFLSNFLIIFDDECFVEFSIEFQIFPNKSTLRILIPASLAQTDDAVFATERKTIEDQRKEEKTLAWLIISADFLQGKSDFCPSVFLGFWPSEGRTQGNSESGTKSWP
jgi:hypothetical protein